MDPGSGETVGEMVTSAIRRVGPLTLCFESLDSAVVARFDSLYAAFPVVEADGEGDELVSIRIERDLDERRPDWACFIDGARCASAASVAGIEETLTRRINRMVLDGEPDRLHLHGGAVTRDGVTLLIIGQSGSGKSTLVAALVARGWAYLSDEQLGVLPGGVIVPYPRPITLRRGSWELFESLGLDAGADASIQRIELPVSDLGSAYTGSPLQVSMIVRPDLSVDETGARQLDAAATVEALVLDTLDLERAGERGFDALVDLALVAPAHRITGRDLDATYALIEILANAPAAETECVDVVHSDEAGLTSGSAWLFCDGTAVIYERESGTLIRLDEPGFRAWATLTSAAKMPEEARLSPFVAELAEAGLVVLESA